MDLILTGGHSGIGLELTKMLVDEGHHLGLILRSEQRRADAIEAIGTTGSVEFFFADLGKQSEVRRVAGEIVSRWGKLDGLFSNAGVLLEQATYSEQGNEMHFEVNTLAPYILSLELMPLLEAAEQPFIVATASGSAREVNKWLPDVPDLKRPERFVKLTGPYRRSKLALVLLMNHLAEEHEEVRVVSVNPGAIRTKMVTGDGAPFFVRLLLPFVFQAPEKGAQRLYDAAFDDEYGNGSGVFVSSKGKIESITNRFGVEDLAQIKEAI